MSEAKCEIDDDHFTYDGGMRQCISGAGANAKAAIDEMLLEIGDFYGTTPQYYIDELVRWCREFNGENQRLKAQLAEKTREAERLRSALVAVQWVDFNDSDHGVQTFCPVCRNNKEYGHYEGCDLDAALKQPEGK